MSNFVAQFGTVKLHVARRREDFRQVNAFRQRYGKVREAMEQDFVSNEILRDQIGKVFTYFVDRQMIASVRYVPIGVRASVIESVFPESISDSDFNLSTWEGTRFVVHPEFRGQGIFGEALAMSMEWLRDNTMCQQIVAPIRRRLYPLYERYGFYHLASPSLLIEDRKTAYMIIMSELITVLNSSVSYGYERATPKYLISLSTPQTINSTPMR